MAETEVKRKTVFMITLIIQLCWSCLGQLSHFLSSSKQRPASGEHWNYFRIRLQGDNSCKAERSGDSDYCYLPKCFLHQLYRGRTAPAPCAGLGTGRAVMSITADLADKVAVMLSFPGLTLIRAIKLT